MARASTDQKIVATDDVWGWLTAFIIAVLVVALPLPAWTIEQVYSRSLYPVLQSCLSGLSNLVPFSLLDILIFGAIFLFGRRVLRLTGKFRTHGVMRVTWEGARRFLRFTSIVIIVFMVTWGLNYRRLPLGYERGAAPPMPTQDALIAAMSDVNVLASRLRETRPGDMDFDAVADLLREPMNAALMQVDSTPINHHARPKYSIVMTPFFTWTGVDGMIDPLSLESIVHPDLLPFERPFALAHEWGHLAGRADEAEASAVGWLACMNGPPPLAYSASLYLLREAGAALPDEARSDAFGRLDPGVRSDLVAIAQRLLQEQPKVQRAAYQMYDEYLKANRVQDGAASYGRALSYILSSPIHDALINYHMGGRVQ